MGSSILLLFTDNCTGKHQSSSNFLVKSILVLKESFHNFHEYINHVFFHVISILSLAEKIIESTLFTIYAHFQLQAVLLKRILFLSFVFHTFIKEYGEFDSEI